MCAYCTVFIVHFLCSSIIVLLYVNIMYVCHSMCRYFVCCHVKGRFRIKAVIYNEENDLFMCVEGWIEMEDDD